MLEQVIPSIATDFRSLMHGELAFLHCAKAYNFKCTIVRYQNIIGPNMGFGHAIPHIVERSVSYTHLRAHET